MFTIVKFWGRRLAGPVFTISLLSLSLPLPLFIITYAYSNHASALTYNNSIDLEYNINPSLDVSFNTNTGFIIENLAPGNASYSNTVVITASSNNSDGYNLLASVGDSNDINRNNNRLVNTNNVNYFESVAANADLELSALGENKWGYAICNDNDSSSTTTTGTCTTWSNYNGLPAVSADRSNDLTLVSTDTAGDTEVLMRIGASSTNTQVAGEFTNKINFFVTTNIVTYDYSITYNANDGSPTTSGNNTVDTTNMPANISGSLQTGQELLTSSNTPIRNNYEFLGWCDGTIDGITCNGNIYQPDDYIKIASASPSNVNNLILNAVWVIYMQNLDLTTCRSIAADAPLTVYDRRDGTSYRVQKLADDNCWMLDNLALDLVATPLKNLDNTNGRPNTNASSEALRYLKNGGGAGNFATTGVSKTWTSSSQNYYDRPMIAVDSATSGPCNNANCVNSDRSWSSTSVTSVAINGTTSVAQGKIGVYYNYCAISAGSYCYAENDGTDSPDGAATLQDSKYDICPKNWRLPTSTSRGEFQNLYNYYAGNELGQVAAFEMALAAPLSGYFGSGKSFAQGYSSNFWSSTWRDSKNMLLLYYNANTVTPSSYSQRFYGRVARCLLSA